MRRAIVLSLLVVLGCHAAHKISFVQNARVKKTLSWRDVAQSHCIVYGRLQVPVKEIEAAQAKWKEELFRIEVTDEKFLKGKPIGEKVTIANKYTMAHYADDIANRHNMGYLIGLDGKQVYLLLFLFGGKRSDYGLYADPPNRVQHLWQCIIPSDDPRADRIRKEVARQKKMLESFEKHFTPEKYSLYAKVKELIDSAVTNAEKQEEAFKELEALGREAVPPIIMLMDDRRQLPKNVIYLRNPPGFEEIDRFYGVELVVDALEKILKQITDEGFGDVLGHGSSEDARQRAVEHWRIYLCYKEGKECAE